MKNKYKLLCPEYALQNKLQEGKQNEIRAPQARLGLNLGLFPGFSQSWFVI